MKRTELRSELRSLVSSLMPFFGRWGEKGKWANEQDKVRRAPS